eukprot:TRINITY_DN2594_c0_g1_i1.p1 TRINITY_DN2594_c0_g1~~TRINITY_DN2594_c0_g1_i1.p1  ORF type:complete len:372 (-),score=100.06 TRINITY_DN2594_c0_g1_i1:63-1178(-)
MPPKPAAKKGKQPSAKQQQKKAGKVVEDKTFGLKNKKGAKAQKFIKNVQQSQVSAKDAKAKAMQKQQQQQARLEKEERDKQLKQLFKPALLSTQKIPPGVDPKSIVCELFKAGACTKGKKCKYSHDLNVERKTQKIDMYSDPREEERKLKEADTMDKWDQTKLEQVINEKSKVKNQNVSLKICKYFLKAIVEQKYGWFWDCPNGPQCQYRHALPEGYKLRPATEFKKEDLNLDPIEDILERERRRLPPGGTKVTAETFALWKAEKLKEKANAEKKAAEEREKEIQSGKAKMSGREMFSYRPDLFVKDEEEDDDDVVDLKLYNKEDEEVDAKTEPETKPVETEEQTPDLTNDLYVEDESLFEETIPEEEEVQ